MVKTQRQEAALGRTESPLARDPFRFDGGPARMPRLKQPRVWGTSFAVVAACVAAPFLLALAYTAIFG